MKVSVVIPAWNAEETIAETLESLLAQKHKGWEAVVVDDGSRDRTAEIVRRYATKDARFRLVQREQGGEAAARNTGLDEATHDWLLFLDSDDWIAPEHLRHMTRALRADPTLDAVHCGYARVTADGVQVIDPYEAPAGDMFETWAKRSAFPVHCCVVRRALVREVGGFDPSLAKSPDWDLWQRVARTGANFGAIRETLAFYRMRPSSASLEAPRMLRDGLTVLRRGHAPDPRVPHPHPAHAEGAPAEEIRTQAWYLLSWCAGLMIGQGQDARSLIELCDVEPFAELYPPGVAQSIWDSAPLPLSEPPEVWQRLWPSVHPRVEEFLVALEEASGAPELASRARSALLRLVLRGSPGLASAADALESAEAKRQEMEGQLRWRDDRIGELEEREVTAKGAEQRLAETQASLAAREQQLRQLEDTLARTQAETRERFRFRDHRINALDLTVQQRDERIGGLEDSLKQRDERIGGLEDSLKQRDERIGGLEDSLKQRDERIGGLEDSLKQRDERIGGLEDSLKQRDERAGGLEDSLRQRDQRIRDLEQAQKLRDERIDGLVASLNQRDERIQEADTALAAGDEQIGEAETRIASLEAQARDLTATRDRLSTERMTLQSSLEHRVGDFLLNRLRLKPFVVALGSLATSWGQRLVNWRLALDRTLRPRQRRLVTTVCWNFPIHSQTFVYQELTHLVGHGFSVRLVYSKIEPRQQLPARYQHLWPLRRRLHQNRGIHERDYHHYRRKMPDRVDALLDRVSEASGLPRHHVAERANFLEAFTFTRMVEAYRPEYLHSYFFYDRSFMALVAGYLLGIPRGVSCYADHVMKDYEFKLVPLHMELCEVVIATSSRIKRELMELAPGADSSKILVKPNGIDPARFPVVERSEPRNGDPYRLVSVCRIEPKKGLLDLVDAVHLLKQRGVRVEAHVVGTADEWSPASVQYKQRLDERISELGLWGTIHLEGRQDLEGVLRFHHLAHLFVAPFVETETGDKDGIPTALLEGMSSGLPAVATDAGSITEVVDDGRDGLIVPQRRPEALADAIEALLSDPAKRSDFGRAAAATVRDRFEADSLERLFHERVDTLLRR